MELNKNMMKALASNTKTSVMKSLLVRNKTSAELSRELSLAPSTMAQHMKELELIGLVERINSENKWIYYKLTQTGKDVIKPRVPMKITILLSAGLLMIAGSFAGFISNMYSAQMLKSTESAAAIVEDYSRQTGFLIDMNLIFISLFIIGLLVVIYSAFRFFR